MRDELLARNEAASIPRLSARPMPSTAAAALAAGMTPRGDALRACARDSAGLSRPSLNAAPAPDRRVSKLAGWSREPRTTNEHVHPLRGAAESLGDVDHDDELCLRINTTRNQPTRASSGRAAFALGSDRSHPTSSSPWTYVMPSCSTRPSGKLAQSTHDRVHPATCAVLE
jgi:hypothetical protein